MIFRHVRQRWLSRPAVWLRWSRAAAYVFTALSGFSALIWTPASIRAATTPVARYMPLIWAGVMAVSAAFCAAGAIADRWLGEYVGLVPLCFVAAAFAVSAVGRGPTAFSGGFFLLGFFLFFVSRWQEVALIKVEALRSASERQDGDGGGL